MKEHNPASPRSCSLESIIGSIVKHLIDINHTISSIEAFPILVSVPRNLNEGLSFRLLSTAKMIGVRFFSAELCEQKRLLRFTIAMM